METKAQSILWWKMFLNSKRMESSSSNWREPSDYDDRMEGQAAETFRRIPTKRRHFSVKKSSPFTRRWSCEDYKYDIYRGDFEKHSNLIMQFDTQSDNKNVHV